MRTARVLPEHEGERGAAAARRFALCKAESLRLIGLMASETPGIVTAAELGEHIGIATRSVCRADEAWDRVKAGPNRFRLRGVYRPLLR